MSEENKAVVRWEMEQLFNRGGNLDTADEIIHPDCVSYEPTSGEMRGIEGAKSSSPPPTWILSDTLREGVAAERNLMLRKNNNRGLDHTAAHLRRYLKGH